MVKPLTFIDEIVHVWHAGPISVHERTFERITHCVHFQKLIGSYEKYFVLHSSSIRRDEGIIYARDL